MLACKKLDQFIFRHIVTVLTKATSLNRGQKQALAMLTDATLCVISVWLAFCLRLGTWLIVVRPMAIVAGCALVLWFIIAHRFDVYRTIFRYAGAGVMLNLAKSCVILAIPMTAIFGFYQVDGIPRTVSLIQPMIFLIMLGWTRITARYLFAELLTSKTFSGKLRNVLVYGAGSAGQQLALSMRHEPGMRMVAFVDDDRRLDGQILDGNHIYSTDRLGNLIEDHNITDVLLALPNTARHVRNKIISSLEQYPVHVMTLPGMAQIVDGRVSVNDLRELNIEDLLGRDAVPPDAHLMGKTIAGKNVVVTGAGGSIGSELCRQILNYEPKELILAEMSEFGLYTIEKELIGICRENDWDERIIVPKFVNCADPQSCKLAFDSLDIDTIFHAAAYKHVPLVEANPLQGLNNNISATVNMVRIAIEHSTAQFILISTDKAVRPTNVMGASKRICELVLQAFAKETTGTIFSMVRFGNVLGSSGSVVPHFERQIREGGPVTITHRNITRYFMTIPEAAQLVIQAGAMANGGEVFVLDMGEPIKIIDLATTMIKLSGLSVKSDTQPDGDIEIQEIGLRPGEKLYEELLIGDNPIPTNHSRIMQAREHMIDLPRLEGTLAVMFSDIEAAKVGPVLAAMRELVPEYIPQNEMLL